MAEAIGAGSQRGELGSDAAHPGEVGGFLLHAMARLRDAAVERHDHPEDQHQHGDDAAHIDHAAFPFRHRVERQVHASPVQLGRSSMRP